MSVFSDRLKDTLRIKGFSQKNFASLIGVTTNSMSSYITGKVYPQIDVLMKMCDILDVSSDWLIGRSQPSETSDSSISNASDIGERIRSRLSELGLTQIALAKAVNLSRSAINLFVMGKCAPSTDNLVLIAKALDVAPDWLRTGTSNATDLVGSKTSNMATARLTDDDAVDGFAEVRLTNDELEVIHRMRCGQAPMFADDASKLSDDVGQLSEAEVEMIFKLRALPDSERRDFQDFLDLKYNRLNPKSKVSKTSLCLQNQNQDPESSDSPTGIA